MPEVVRDFVPGSDDAAVAALWQRVFGAPRGGQSIAWLFRDGPAGPSPRAVLEVDGRIVAHAGAMPLRCRVDGRDVLGAWSVGAMTDPDFQGRGAFFRLGTHLYERLTRDGFAFVAGFSNQRSHRLMTGPLGRTPIRPFPWAIKVLRPLGLLRSLLGRGGPVIGRAPVRPGSGEVRVAEADFADARLDRIWQQARDTVEVGAVRDAAWAQWRYGDRPDAGYRLLLAERRGEPVAWLVYRVLPLRGVQAAFVLDFVAVPGQDGAAAALLQELARLAIAEGASLLSVLLPGAGPARKALKRAGFLRVPEKLHPQLVRFSVRGLGAWQGTTSLLRPAAWHLSWADTDVV